MKVFISHSSTDKWVARKVSEDLVSLGISTFLDEKDIKTGESIDESIREHLVDSDHFLILLSPASVKSEWVLVELGGAIALQKHLVPVLLYLGANDIPSIIKRYLARDINDLQKYYEELLRSPAKRKVGPKVPDLIAKSSAKPRPQRPGRLRSGDIVLLPVEPPSLLSDEESRVGWNGKMNDYLGRTARVIEIERIDGMDLVRLDIDRGEFAWFGGWLVPQR